MPTMHRIQPVLVPLLAVVLADAACVPECIGLACGDPAPVPQADDDTSVGDDDSTAAGDDDTTPPLLDERSCEVTLRFQSPWPTTTMSVAGSFNGWVPAPAQGPAGDGSFSLDLGALAPGSYAWKALPNGEWESAPPPDQYSQWSDGVENRSLRVGDCTVPLLQVEHASLTPDGTLSAVVRFARAAGGLPLDPQSVVVTLGGSLHAATADPATGLITVEAEGLAPGKHSLRVHAADEDGRAAENDGLWLPLWVEGEAWTWRDGLMYFAFLDRFRNGDVGETQPAPPVEGVPVAANYQGGDLLGLLQAIEDGWFAELGADVLWLSPLLDNPGTAYSAADGIHSFSGFHGYWPVSADRIDEHLGDTGSTAEDRLDEVIQAAHSRGIRVIFDLVLNHVHEDHPYLDEHPEWFGGGCTCGAPGCGWDERARDCWFMPYLPDLDYRNHAVLERVVDDTVALLARYDVDGVRIDAAKHMDHVVMRTLRLRLQDEVERGIGAPFHLVGETFTGADGHDLIMDYVAPWELNGQFDFPLYWPIRDAFAHGGSLANLDAAVLTGQERWGDAVMSPFFGNHDVARFVTEAAGNGQGGWGATPDLLAEGGTSITQWDLIGRITLAAAFTLTQEGLPLLYYGDEIGLAGDGDPDNRRLMSFPPYLSANQEEVLRRIRGIGQTRRSSFALRRGEYRSLWFDGDTLVYARDAGGGEVAVVAIHKGSGSLDLEVPLQGVLPEGTALLDATHPDRTATVEGGQLRLQMGGWDWAIFVVGGG